MDLAAEKRRLQNIEDNKRILAEIGLINPFKALTKVQLKKSGLKRKCEEDIPRKAKKPLLEDNKQYGSVRTTRRRSARILGKDAPEVSDSDCLELEEWEEAENRVPRVQPNRPNHYGPIPGVEVGASWLTRLECCKDGIHRPTVAGIHAGSDGAYSVALSGGYDDNVDLGECFTYTGEGGRNLKGTKDNPKNLRMAPQSKDQTLTRGNLALHTSVETGHPVRVIRGYKLTSPFAPDEGYRYDGLYTVKKAWYTCGMSGFGVWKFALERCKDQPPPPWTLAEEIEGMAGGTQDKAFSEKDEATKSEQSARSEAGSNPPGCTADDVTYEQSAPSDAGSNPPGSTADGVTSEQSAPSEAGSNPPGSTADDVTSEQSAPSDAGSNPPGSTADDVTFEPSAPPETGSNPPDSTADDITSEQSAPLDAGSYPPDGTADDVAPEQSTPLDAGPNPHDGTADDIKDATS